MGDAKARTPWLLPPCCTQDLYLASLLSNDLFWDEGPWDLDKCPVLQSNVLGDPVYSISWLTHMFPFEGFSPMKQFIPVELRDFQKALPTWSTSQRLDSVGLETVASLSIL